MKIKILSITIGLGFSIGSAIACPDCPPAPINAQREAGMSPKDSASGKKEDQGGDIAPNKSGQNSSQIPDVDKPVSK